MNIRTVKTDKISVGDMSLTDVLDSSVSELTEGSIVVITSKIVSICEGRVVRTDRRTKRELIEEEADLFIPPEHSKYDISLTITHDILIPTAGIDESNGNGYYILWPSDPFATARTVRAYLAERFSLRRLGVLISDSKTTALRWGTTGASLGHAGFDALKDYIGTEDLFGHALRVTKANIADGLAAAAVTVMGEGSEQTPIAIISDVPFVRFHPTSPSPEDIRALVIDPEDDLYKPLIRNAPWIKGKRK